MPTGRRSITALEREAQQQIVDSVARSGVVLLRNSRGKFKLHGQWFSFGLGPNGTSDLIGWKSFRIRQEHIGKMMARFCAIEVKRIGETATAEQQEFIHNVLAAGGIAGIAESWRDADVLLGGEIIKDTRYGLTNDDEYAQRFHAIDAAYLAARKAAEALPMREKIEAYRKAKAVRHDAYDAIRDELDDDR